MVSTGYLQTRNIFLFSDLRTPQILHGRAHTGRASCLRYALRGIYHIGHCYKLALSVAALPACVAGIATVLRGQLDQSPQARVPL
jgi:hypothetical protein